MIQPLLEHQCFKLGEWLVDPLRNTVTKDNQSIKIEKRLIKVLVALTKNFQGVSKDQLLAEVWAGKVVSEDTLSVAISQLRKTLGCEAKNPVYIETITGYGFRLMAPVIATENYIYNEMSSDIAPAYDSKTKVNTKEKSINFLHLFLYLAMVVLLVIAIFFGLGNKLEKPERKNLLDDERYGKARYLLQQKNLAGLQQAEMLLKQLNELYPDTPAILNEFGKAKFSQIAYLEKSERPPTYVAAKQIFQQLLRIAPNIAEAHLHLALIAIAYDHDLTKAQEYFTQSIALDPGNIIAHLHYAELLLAIRDFKQAVHHNKIAQALDPNHYASASIAWVYNMADQHEDAKKELAKLYSIDPESPIYHVSALKLYENTGEEGKAFRHYLAAFEMAGYSAEDIASATSAFKHGGLKQLNHWLANIKQEQQDIGQYLPPVATARYHVAAGELDKAMDYLELAYEQDNYLLLWINSDPKYRPLTNSPRFNKLVVRLGLKPRGN